MQPTPLAASEIAPILRAGFGYTDITIYRCGAADGQLVGRQVDNAVPMIHLFHLSLKSL